MATTRRHKQKWSKQKATKTARSPSFLCGVINEWNGLSSEFVDA